jgi:hypothetical protein
VVRIGHASDVSAALFGAGSVVVNRLPRRRNRIPTRGFLEGSAGCRAFGGDVLAHLLEAGLPHGAVHRLTVEEAHHEAPHADWVRTPGS